MPFSASVSGSDSLKRKLEALGESVQGRMLERALVAGALIIQNAAKENAPYRTGNLRRSIHIGGHEDLAPDRQGIEQATGQAVPAPEVRDADVAVYVGTDVEYARRIEYGFSGADALGREINQPAQPYLRPAVDENGDAVNQEVSDALRDLIRAAIR